MEANLSSAEGEVISVFLRRTREGVQVEVKAHPDVEEFFRKWSGGQRADARAAGGRLWNAPGGDPLLFWMINGTNARGYNLNIPGAPLIDDDEGGSPNISFIQLEGVSSPGGRTFTCDIVLSRQELERMSKKISAALGQFYNDYIKPASLQVVVSTKQSAASPF